MSDGVTRLQHGAEHFDLQGLEGGAASEISFKSLDDGLLVTAQHRNQTLEVVEPNTQWRARLLVEGLALALQQQVHALDFLRVESL
ncbi:hypothetical protein D3C78_1885710 [compost metagenome]